MEMLPKLKRYDKKLEYSYCFGAFPTIDLLKSRHDAIYEVFLKKEGVESDGVGEVLRLCKMFGIRCGVNDRLIERIAFKENTYVVGVFKKFVLDLSPDTNHIVLVEPSNTGNLGTIIRTMLGFGFKDLAIVRPAVDIFEPKVVRSSMGAIFNIRFKYYNTFDDYIKEFDARTLYPFMLDGAKDIREVVFKEPFSFIQGNEGSGLSDMFKDVGQSVYIPHSNGIDSLNLSIATGLGMWEYYSKKNE